MTANVAIDEPTIGRRVQIKSETYTVFNRQSDYTYMVSDRNPERVDLFADGTYGWEYVDTPIPLKSLERVIDQLYTRLHSVSQRYRQECLLNYSCKSELIKALQANQAFREELMRTNQPLVKEESGLIRWIKALKQIKK